MKDKFRAARGQFSIIAALLMTTILVASVIITYAAVRNLPFQKSPKTLSSIEEMNLSIKNVLEFTVGRYGSILKVTGNSTFANEYVIDYVESGLLNIAHSHPEWSPSFTIDYTHFSTLWFEPTGYSQGDISVTYSLLGLGIDGMKYETSSLLNVTILGTLNANQTQILVKREKNKPDLTLGRDNFFFYSYSYSESAWKLVNPSSDPIPFSNGTYLVDIPPGVVDPSLYMIQVVDQRGIMATALFSQSGRPQYTYTFTWDEKYENLTRDTIVVEVLQNGTLRWLGQNLLDGKPIPPMAVKAFHINQTINGVNREVPFQVENWASNYMVPLSLSSNESLFSNRDMIVFLVNHNVSKVTLWWDGRDVATQTPYATTNRYFLNDKPENRKLTNGILNLTMDFSQHAGVESFKVVSTVGTSKSTAEFMRINNKVAHYGHAEPTYPIVYGIVRDVVQHEVEWDNGGAPDSPNVYAQIVLTLPANATYYTYALRTIFVNSIQYRNLTDLSPIQLSSESISGLRSFTENGTSGGFPLINETLGGQTNLFYNFSSSTGWAHHWSEYINGNIGGGIMFTDSSNLKLYTFDSIAEEKTGALYIATEHTEYSEWITPTAVHSCCGGTNYNNAIDENTWTYWRHSSSCNHWIVFDMGETMNISKIRIYQSWWSSYRWGRSSGIEVYVSDDPDDWGSAVWIGTLDASGWRESGEFEAEGRYVKLYSKSSSSSQRMYEIEIKCVWAEQSVTIEFSPVARFPAFFTHPLDVTWYGAVVTFDGDDPIWSDDKIGLWVLVEHPPIITVG